MKLTKKAASIISLVAACVMLAVAVIAAGGDSSDPLVAQSYVDKKVNDLESMIDDLNTRLTQVKNSIPTNVQSVSDQLSYKVVTLKNGQTLYASGDGSTSLEVIYRRGGTVIVVSPFTDASTKQGVSDFTHGTEIFNGETVPTDSYLIIPRGSDGRGLKVTNLGEGHSAYFLVRGEYEIK